ncbi:putative quinol monooxygenase [Ostreiculturibacter nitratireducens]|uniref:putative quinol monooxygenase n=1 Tax=Ostreiculturibacter nitratireducens TaxID=3075226 RepID=UPI0031B59BB6
MPRVTVTGFLICRSLEEADRAASLLPEHTRLTRAEAGCLRFEVFRSMSDPCRFAVHQIFASPEDYDAHRERTRASVWAKGTKGIIRELRISEQ